MKIKTVKITVQTLLFILICVSFWYLRYPLSEKFNPIYLFQLSPVTFLISNFFTAAVFMVLFLILVTFIFGRVFCGWICPYGTLMDIASFIAAPLRKYKESQPSFIKSKYFLLVLMTVFLFLGFQIFYMFEPITIFARGFYFTVYSVKNNILVDVFDKIMSGNPGIISESIYSFFKSSVIENRHVVFNNNFITFIFFAVPLFFVLIKRRFWCRYICPLGACLAIIARLSLLKRKSLICSDGCLRCVNQCRMNAVKNDNSYVSQECILCGDCIDGPCGKKSEFVFLMPFKKQQKLNQKNGITRKDFILWSLAGLVLFFGWKKIKNGNRNVIRPPGAEDEESFKVKCVRCGNCMKVCVTNGLQPVLLESGFDGVWTPKLDPNTGYCEYECVLCGKVCPTGAIRKLSEKEKIYTKIGIAKIQKDVCAPWKDGLECLVCEEHCPVASKAIKLQKITVNGNEVQAPYIEEELCVGCSICENKCPAFEKNKKGIIVEPI